MNALTIKCPQTGILNYICYQSVLYQQSNYLTLLPYLLHVTVSYLVHNIN